MKTSKFAFEINYLVLWTPLYRAMFLNNTSSENPNKINWCALSFLVVTCGRAHNSSPHKWYCHFWDWHNWYLTLLIKLKLILVNIGTLNYWYWAQFTLTLLKFDISDLQNDWHLQVLMFGIIGISCFWFLELIIFSMSDIKHDWYKTWLTLAYLIFGISGIEHYQKLGVAVIIYYWFMMP